MKLLDDLLKVGFLTGSRAMGTHREDSDYDIAFSIEKFSIINNLIGGMKRTNSEYNASFYIESDGMRLNLIPLHPHEYMAWYLTTKSLKASIVESGIKNRIHIHAIFGGMVNLFKGMLPQLKDLNSYSELNNRHIGRIN